MAVVCIDIDCLQDGAKAFPGAAQFLQQLKNDGMTVVVVSPMPSETFDWIDPAGLAGLISNVVFNPIGGEIIVNRKAVNLAPTNGIPFAAYAQAKAEIRSLCNG